MLIRRLEVICWWQLILNGEILIHIFVMNTLNFMNDFIVNYSLIFLHMVRIKNMHSDTNGIL